MNSNEENLTAPSIIASTNIKNIIQEASDNLRLSEAHMTSDQLRQFAANVLTMAASVGNALVGIANGEAVDLENVVETVKEGCGDCLLDNPIISVDDESLKTVEAALSLADSAGTLCLMTQLTGLEEESVDSALAARELGRAMLCLVVLSKQFSVDLIESLTTYYANKKSNRRF